MNDPRMRVRAHVLLTKDRLSIRQLAMTLEREFKIKVSANSISSFVFDMKDDKGGVRNS